MSAPLRALAAAALALAAATAEAQPANDAFAARVSLGSANPASGAGSNVGASKEAGEPNHGGAPGGRSVWWSWTAPANGVATVSTAGSGFDTLLGVYTGNAVAGLAFVAGNDDTPVAYLPGVPQKTSLATFNAVAGTTYQIAVDGFFNASGSVSLSISLAVGSAPPTLSISDATVTEQDFGVTTASFAVTLSAPSGLPVTVAFATGAGTATAGVDYVPAAGTLHFSPGVQTRSVSVIVNGDAAVEANETFNVTLSAPTNATLADAVGLATITNDEGAPATATDLAWQPGTVATSTYPGMPSINGVAYGNATYVVVGDYGDIWSFTTSWTPRANPDPGRRPLRGVAFGGGLFVAVGGCCAAYGGAGIPPLYAGGPILTSADGANWTYQGALGDRGLHAVAYGGGRFVAVGARGTVATSTTGGNPWLTGSIGIADYLGVAFGGGAFVAVGERGSIIRSTDGLTWTSVGTPGEDLRAVTHTGTQFVAVGASGTILTSPTGTAWTPRASGTEASLSGVAFGAGTLAAVGANDVVLTSANGTTWTAQPRPQIIGESRALRTVAFGVEFLAGGDDGALVTSLTGAAWSALTFITSGLNRAVAFNGTTTYCAVGHSGSVASSANGVAWTLQLGLGGRPLWHWSSVASSGSVFVAVGDGAEIMSSPDCAAWTERNAGATADPATGIAGRLSDVTFGGGVFAAVGEEMPNSGEGVALVATSPDGTTWTQRAPSGLSGDEHALSAVAFGGGRFVALGMNRATGRVVSAVSTDNGVNWSAQALAPFAPWEEVQDLAFGSNVFVAVGDRIWSSPDGVVWTLRRGFAGEALRAVAFGGGRFVAAGELGTLLGSRDGTQWAANLRPAIQDLLGLVPGPAAQPDLLVGVGDSVAVSSGTPIRPPNDNLASAIAVAGASYSTTGSNVYGTKEAGEPSHAGNPGGRSVWWAWTAPQTGKAMVRTAGSSLDTLLAVYTGATMASLNLVGASDDFVDASSRVRFDAVGGTTYRFAVDGFGGNAGAIALAGGTAPVNDDFAEQTALAPFATGGSGSNLNATKEAGEPNHAGNAGGRSVWWSWTAPAPGTVTLSTAGSALDTLLAVYTGNVARPCSPPAIAPPNCLSVVAVNDDEVPGSILTSRVTFTAATGTTYRVAVDGFGGAQGTIVFSLGLQVPPPSVSVADVGVTEGHSGTKSLVFTVSLGTPSNLAVSVTAATTGGTATPGGDYLALPPTAVNFAAGQTSQNVSVTVNGDTTVEPDETVALSLSNPVNATFAGGDPEAVGTIANDDTQVSIDDVSVSELPAGPRDAVFTVTLTPAVPVPVTVQYATADGTAVSPADYTSASGTLSFPASTPTRTIPVAIQPDGVREGTETFTVTLSNPPAGAAIVRATGTGRIFDPGSLFTVTPCRLADTRGAAAPALTPGPDRTFVVAGRCGVPPSARAASLNVTVTDATNPGNLRLYAAGAALPLASVINYGPGQARANNAIIPVGTGGEIAVRLDQAAGSVHFILDVNGYIE